MLPINGVWISQRTLFSQNIICYIPSGSAFFAIHTMHSRNRTPEKYQICAQPCPAFVFMLIYCGISGGVTKGQYVNFLVSNISAFVNLSLISVAETQILRHLSNLNVISEGRSDNFEKNWANKGRSVVGFDVEAQFNIYSPNIFQSHFRLTLGNLHYL